MTSLGEKDRNRAKSLFEKGIDFYKKEKFQDALNLFEESLVKYQNLIASGNKDAEPELAVLYRHIGNCLGATGNNQKAVEMFEISIVKCSDLIAKGHNELKPDLIHATMNRGVCFMNLGNLPEARAILEKGIADYDKLIIEDFSELESNLARTYMNLGKCLANIGDFRAAFNAYQESIRRYESLVDKGHTEFRPDLAITQLELGGCLKELEDFETARRIYEKCLKDFQSLIDAGHADLNPYIEVTRCILTASELLISIQLFQEIGDSLLKEFKMLSEIIGCATEQFEIEKAIESCEQILETLSKGSKLQLPDLSCIDTTIKKYLPNRVEQFNINSYIELFTSYDDTKNMLTDFIPIVKRLAKLRKDISTFQKGPLEKTKEHIESAIEIATYFVNNEQYFLDKGIVLSFRPMPMLISLKGEALGLYFEGVKKFSEAYNIYEQGLDEYQVLIDQGHTNLKPELTKTRMYMGRCLEALGDINAAHKLLEQTFSEFQSLIKDGDSDLYKNLPDLLEIRRTLADHFVRLGDFKSAHGLMEENLNQFQNLIKDGYTDLQYEFIDTQLKLGLLFENPGKRVGAIEEYIKQDTSLSIEQLIRSRGMLGQAFLGIGDFSKACMILEENLKDIRRLIEQEHRNLHIELAETLISLGICYGEFGNFAKACTLLQESKEKFNSLIRQADTELSSEMAMMHTGLLAHCLYQLGNHREAQKLLQENINICEEIIKSKNADFSFVILSIAYLNMGIYFCETNDFFSAYKVLKQGVDESQKLVSGGLVFLYPLSAIIRMALADCLYKLGNFDDVENTNHLTVEMLKELNLKNQIFPQAIEMLPRIVGWYCDSKRPAGTDKPRAYELAKTGLDWLDTLLARISDPAKGHLIEKNMVVV
jgi:tetratricopeptide (TPR) repeat protein